MVTSTYYDKKVKACHKINQKKISCSYALDGQPNHWDSRLVVKLSSKWLSCVKKPPMTNRRTITFRHLRLRNKSISNSVSALDRDSFFCLPACLARASGDFDRLKQIIGEKWQKMLHIFNRKGHDN